MQPSHRPSTAPPSRPRTRSATNSTVSMGATLSGSTTASASTLSRGDRVPPSPTNYSPSGSPSTRSRRKSEDATSMRAPTNKLRKRASRPVLPPSAYPDPAVANHVLRKMKSDISSRLHVKNVPETPLPPPGRQLRSKIPTSLFPLPPDDTQAEAVVVPPGRRAGNCLFTACADTKGFDEDVVRQRKTSSVGILIQTEVHHTREGSIRRQSIATKSNHSGVTTTVSKLPQSASSHGITGSKSVIRY